MIEAFAGVEDGAQRTLTQTKNLETVLGNVFNISGAQFFKETANGFKEFNKGTGDAVGLISTLYSESRKLNNVEIAFNTVSTKGITSFDTNSSEIQTLAEFTGLPVEYLVTHWQESSANIREQIGQAKKEGKQMFDEIISMINDGDMAVQAAWDEYKTDYETLIE